MIRPKNSKEILDLLKSENIEFVDLRFTDILGIEHHVTIPSTMVDEGFFRDGKMFDGSSISGWKGIENSDMMLIADDTTSYVDPFTEHRTLVLRCNVVDPVTRESYNRDPRGIAQKCVEYLKTTGIADTVYVGPEPEFFIFDNVRWKDSMQECYYEIDSNEGHWETGEIDENGNKGYRPGVKGGYFPVPPTDSLQDIRSEMCSVLSELGHSIEVHHHEVATAGQCEIGTRFGTLVKKADEMMEIKYVLKNVAVSYGKTLTFMPKPLVGDNGSGMHVHSSLIKDGVNIFAGNEYSGLSETALYYIGGLIKHAKALNAIVNPSTNSYKRLVPGYEAPVLLAYSACNRSASIRIPYVPNPKGRRIEVRFSDMTANPYLAFSAIILAGIDGIKNKIHPGEASDKDLYKLSKKELASTPKVAENLQEALTALDKDREFLTSTGVFCDDFIDSFIELKEKEVNEMNKSVHPLEFQYSYDC